MEVRSLSRAVWQEQKNAYARRLAPFASDRVDRMAKGIKHPVRDFLFEYYSFRPSQLLRWSPGFGVLLEGAKHRDLQWGKDFRETPEGLVLQAEDFPDHRLKFLFWACDYLKQIASRSPQFGCFGLHEWAMVYRDSNIRHAQTPLRLLPDQIATVVENEVLCCTHFDAFRFFTPAAVPRNKFVLCRDETNKFDQPGCVHVTMDLYKFAYKIAPWVDAELMADAFELAWRSRQLDMRASPYDVRHLGLEPIAIETTEGKEEYIRHQQELVRLAEPIRTKLIANYEELCAAKTVTSSR